MDEQYLSFRLKDTVLGTEISLQNMSLPILSEYADQVARFLRGAQKIDPKNIRTAIKDGSLVLEAENEAGILESVFEDYRIALEERDLGLMDEVRAIVIEEWQTEAMKHPDREYELILGSRDKPEEASIITINKSSDYKIPAEIWVPVEKYLYGRIYDLGGKNVANIHIELENGSSITVGTEAKTLVEDKTNRLYKNQLVRIGAEENIRTKKLRNEHLISFENYDPCFNDEEHEEFVSKGTAAWASVLDPSAWVEELRGNA